MVVQTVPIQPSNCKRRRRKPFGNSSNRVSSSKDNNSIIHVKVTVSRFAQKVRTRRRTALSHRIIAPFFLSTDLNWMTKPTTLFMITSLKKRKFWMGTATRSLTTTIRGIPAATILTAANKGLVTTHRPGNRSGCSE